MDNLKEKLQPLITHKFWIIFGLALMMPVIGWLMASGKLKADIETRTSAVNGALSKAGSGTNENKEWTAKLNEINDVQEEEFKEVSKKLFLGQREMMVWPKRMSMMATKEYRGEFADNKPKYFYKDLYADLHKDVYLKVDPIRVDLENKIQGNIRCDESSIYYAPINPKRRPTWKVIWDAQEDLWLTQSLLESIKRINGDARITEVPIRELTLLSLVGGSRSGEGEASTSASTGSSTVDEDDDGDIGDGGLGAMMGAMGIGDSGGGGSSGASGGGLDFPIEDEFGAAGGSATSGSFGGSRGASSGRRYVDDDTTMPFKTRGFKLSLVLKQASVPMVLTELMKSKWPVEIVRYHQQDLHMDGAQMAGGSMGGGGMMGMMGGAMGGGLGGAMGGADEDDEGSYGGYGGSSGGFGGGGAGFGAAGGMPSPGFGATGGGAGFGGGTGGFGESDGGYGGYGGGAGSVGFGAMGGGFGGGQGANFGTRGATGARARAQTRAGQRAQMQMAEVVRSAMSDHYLVRLVVAGTITLYREPPDLAEEIKNASAAVTADKDAFKDIPMEDPNKPVDDAPAGDADAAGVDAQPGIEAIPNDAAPTDSAIDADENSSTDSVDAASGQETTAPASAPAADATPPATDGDQPQDDNN